jgi:membrane-bound serine protease (ClpP class)
LAVEILVLPGFGIAGISGIIFIVGSLVLIMVNNEAFDFEFVRMTDILRALAAVMAGLLGFMVLFFVGGARLPDTKFFKKIALNDTQESAQGYSANFITQVLTGKKGTAQTVLRPAGKVIVEGTIYDASTRGEYIEKGVSIEVINVIGSSVLVKQLMDNA